MKKRRRINDSRRKIIQSVIARCNTNDSMYHEVLYSDELGFVFHNDCIYPYKKDLALCMNAILFGAVLFGYIQMNYCVGPR